MSTSIDAADRVLTINTGSSSLKVAVFATRPAEALIVAEEVERTADPAAALRAVLERLRRSGDDQPLAAVAHRIVHGGPRYQDPQLITADVIGELRTIVAIDPDHMPQALAAIQAVTDAHPTVPQIACFDTAFHRSLPRVAQMYALPRHFRDAGVRRYGFHGLSCEYIVSELARTDRSAATGRVVIAHLGSGASLTAVRDGRSVETTMGFSPTGGVIMGTRSGDLDPGVLLYALQRDGMSADAISMLINRKAGLAGVSETSSDMRDLLARESTDSRASDAIALFCYAISKSIGALMAALGGLDTLIFTAGIGEHAAPVRARICAGLGCFGIELDAARNDAHAPIISRDGGRVVTRVMKTDEDLMLARHARLMLSSPGSPSGLASGSPSGPDPTAAAALGTPGPARTRMFEFDATISSAITCVDDRSATAPPPVAGPLSAALLDSMHRYWSAANYLTIGQIYLQDNPLLREPLTAAHIKPRLLGHWGTSPGLSFIYVHLNRLITEVDANVIVLAGPGHGGPAMLANAYLEGTYSEIYPTMTQDLAGLRRLFRQFSTPGGVPSHVSAPTPGSIHEGGELGYVLSHAFGAAFDNPDLIAVAVVGDGEAETGPLAGSWKSTSFLNPARDGAVLPVLHLNGYRIAGPTVLGRTTDQDVRTTIEGEGYEVHFVEGDDPVRVHQAFAATLDACYARIRAIQAEARSAGVTARPRWPAIVLRTPKGWTGPKELNGVPIEGTFRAHQVPLADVRDSAEQLAMLEAWLRSYQPERAFDSDGRLAGELRALAPAGDRRIGANPHANGGRLLRDLDLPAFASYAIPVERPATERHESTRRLGALLRDVFARNAAQANFRVTCPDEMTSNRLGDVFTIENRCFVGKTIDVDDHVSPTGRVMEVLSEHLCEGWLEGYLLTGRHGLFVTYEAFAMVSASMTVQHTKWLEEALTLPWRAPVASLNILLTSTCWRNDHNGFSHQGPGLIDVMLSKRGTVARIYLPPDANCLLSVADHCLRSRNYVNLIVIDKQPQLQWLDIAAASDHCGRGASIWGWASTDEGRDPDVVLAAAGDVPTLETVAAAWWLRRHAPELRVRCVNVADLMTLFPADIHPHGLDDERFDTLFTADRPVIFAFHGYQRAIHQILHGRSRAGRFHVRGFNEQGTTTTPFGIVTLNEMSRYHLAIEAIRRVPRMAARAPALIAEYRSMLQQARTYAYERFEDPPEISQWSWTDEGA